MASKLLRRVRKPLARDAYATQLLKDLGPERALARTAGGLKQKIEKMIKEQSC